MLKASQLLVNENMESLRIYQELTFGSVRSILCLGMQTIFMHVHSKTQRSSNLNVILLHSSQDEKRILAQYGSSTTLEAKKVLSSPSTGIDRFWSLASVDEHFSDSLFLMIDSSSTVTINEESRIVIRLIRDQLKCMHRALSLKEMKSKEPQNSEKSELQALRFLRHEIKNSLMGVFADFESLKQLILQHHAPCVSYDNTFEELDDETVVGLKNSCKNCTTTSQEESGFSRSRITLEDVPSVCSPDPPLMSKEEQLQQHSNSFATDQLSSSNTPGGDTADFSPVQYDQSAKSAPIPSFRRNLSFFKASAQIENQRFSNHTEALRTCVESIEKNLDKTMECLLSTSAVQDVLEDRYSLRLQLIDLGEVCAQLPIPSAGLDVWPTTFCLETDWNLLNHILTNAVSNAMKYGETSCDPVQINFEAEEDSKRFDIITIRVINKPGHEHAKLMALTQPSDVFKQGVRFHLEDEATGESNTGKFSSGDGAWIMQQCAKALGGRCSIEFKPETTIFSLQFRARVVSPLQNSLSSSSSASSSMSIASHASSTYGSISSRSLQPRHFSRNDIDSEPIEVPISSQGDAQGIDDDIFEYPAENTESPNALCNFEIPAETTLICLDDSDSQLRIMGRYFHQIRGIRFRLLGADDVENFETIALQLIEHSTARPSVRLVFFIDEVLRYKNSQGMFVAASGTALGLKLLARLREDTTRGLEERVLLLVRSAHDAPADLDCFEDALHGHFPKVPMNLAKFLSILAIKWNARWGDTVLRHQEQQ